MVLGSGLYLWFAISPYIPADDLLKFAALPRLICAPRAPRRCPRLLSVAIADDNEKDKRNGQHGAALSGKALAKKGRHYRRPLFSASWFDYAPHYRGA